METQMIINGIRYIDKDQYDDVILRGEDFYEQWMLTCIKSLGYIPGVWLDVGAHVGNHSIYFANHCLADKVYAYEPTLSTYRVLQENITNNNANVTALNLAVGSKIGKCKIVEYNTSGINSVEYSHTGVDCVVLDDISERVGLIKIDVEGFEFEVLKGAKNLIERDRPELFIETFSDRSEIEALIPSCYKFIEVYNNAPTYHYSARFSNNIVTN